MADEPQFIPRRCECGQYPDVCARYGHAGGYEPGEAIEPQFISPWYRRCDNPQCRFNYVYEAEQGQPHYHYLGAGLPVEPD